MNLPRLMTSLALPSPKTMTVLGTCNSSPVCCSRYLLIFFYLLPVGYRYIDAPCFSYGDEDCCMKGTMIRQSESTIITSKTSFDAKGPSIRSPLLFICGDMHVKSINEIVKGPSIRSPLLFLSSDAHVKSIS
jgi:hypothetical protein